MSELDDILARMDETLFQDYTPEEQAILDGSSKEQETPPVYQEDIPNAMAAELLAPNDFDDKCHYQLITTEFEQIVVKIDDRISEEDEAKALELDANTDKLHRKEFVIASSDSDKDGYAQLHDSIATGPAPYITPSNKSPIKNIGVVWLVVMIVILGLSFVLGVVLLCYLLFIFRR